MAEDFDPYRKWLGILPKDQPPNHYRLLGIELFESDADVIEGAADRQMAHLRTFQAGPHSAFSQKLLNECSAARLALLDPTKRAEYDRQLRAQMATAPSSVGNALRGVPSADSSAVSHPADPQAGAPVRDEGVSPIAQPHRIAASQPVPFAKPVSPTSPLSVMAAVPVIVADDHGATSSIHRRTSHKTPLWRQPALLGTAGALVIFAAIAFALTRGGKVPQVADGTQKTQPHDDVPLSPTNAQDTPRTSAADQSTAVPEVAPPPVQAPEQPPVQAAVPSPADFEILEASWGVDDKRVNVTEAVRGLVKDNRLLMMVFLNLLGDPEDPAPGTEKKLRIRYRSRAKEYVAEYFKFWFVYLDGNALAPPTDSPGALEVLEARYGAATTYVDVSPQVRERLRNGRLAVSPSDFAATAAAELQKIGISPNLFKVLWIRYRNSTGEHFTYGWNSDLIAIDARTPTAAGPPVDLLKLIDLKRDVVQGAWELNDGVLQAPGTQYARVQLPYDPPDDYMLTTTVDAAEELRDIGGILLVGGKQVKGVVDGDSGNRSGLHLVDGKLVSGDNNPTCRWRCARMLEQGRVNMLVYIVHPDRVRVLRDGAEIVRWSGNAGTFSIADRWRIPSDRRLSVQAYDKPFRVHKLELVPLRPEKSPMVVVGESGSPIDVLSAIDLDRDRLRGNWQYDGRTLISPAADVGKLQLPAIVPPDYQLDVVAQRESGGDCLTFTLPIAGAQATLLIDGYQGKLSGLQAIDGKNVDSNESKHEGSIFADGKSHSIHVIVRKNHVRLVCDGNQVVDWTGDVSRLKPPEPFPYNDRIYVGNWHSRYRLTQIKLRPLRGDSADQPPALAGEPIDMPSATPKQRIFPDWASDNDTDARSPEPNAETQKEARKAFQKKYASARKAAKTPDQRRELAQEWAQKAAVSADKDADTYVLLKEAIDLAEAAGEIDLAWQTIDQLAKTFAVDSLALRNQSLVEIGKTASAKSPDRAWQLSDAACRLMSAALAAGDAAAVKKAAAQAQSFSKRTNDKTIQKEVNSRATDAGKWAAKLEDVAQARETLKTSAGDPAANFTVGHYELCATGDFDAALPKLAKSSDAAWKKLAGDELALANRQPTGPRTFVNGRLITRSEPAEAQRELAVADAWWSRAEEEPWPATHYLRMRAAKWYASAYRSLVDTGRTRAAERLKTLLATDDGFPHWELFNRQLEQAASSGEVVQIDNRGGLETAVEYGGPIDVTLSVRTTGTEIRLGSHNWSWNWNFKVLPNQWHTVRFIVNPLLQSAIVDGVPLQTETSQTPRKLGTAPVSIRPWNDEVMEVRKFIVKGT